MNQSDTPRTDEAVQGVCNQNRLSPYVPASFARQLERDLIRLSAEREKDKHKASEITARAVRKYLDECSASEKWPDEDKVDQLFADNFAPIIHHKLSRAESTLAERDNELAEERALRARSDGFRETLAAKHKAIKEDRDAILDHRDRIAAQLLAAQTVNARVERVLSKLSPAQDAMETALAIIRESSPGPTLLDEVKREKEDALKLCDELLEMVEEYHNCNWEDEPFTPDIDGLANRISRLRQSTRETEEKV